MDDTENIFMRKIVICRKKIIMSTTKIPYGPLEQLVALVGFIFGILACLTFFPRYIIFMFYSLYIYIHTCSHM